MPTCCADNCTNSWKKGFKMCRFPTDISRRRIWTDNINRTNWTPGRFSSLCQVHFAPEMWETRRVDGFIKLKWNAIPTLFGDKVLQIKPIEDIRTENNDQQNTIEKNKELMNESISQMEFVICNDEFEESDQTKEDFTENTNNSTVLTTEKNIQSDENIVPSCKNCKELERKVNEYRKKIFKVERLRKSSNEKLKRARQEIKRLQKHILIS